MSAAQISKLVLRIHGSFLIALTIFLLILSGIGALSNIGVFAFLHGNSMAHIGLFQAYSLMLLIGIVLWIGSYQSVLWVWDLVGLLAHISPLLAGILFADFLAELSLETGMPGSIPLHTFFILVELAVLLYFRISMKEESVQVGI